MRTTVLGFGMLALAASVAPGQPAPQATQERVFPFVHTQTTQNAEEIATAMKVIADMSQVQVTSGKAPESLTVRGTAEQIALAEWLFIGLDQPVIPQPDLATRDYRLSGTGENVVRLYYVNRATTVQSFQEVATAVRTVVEIRRIVTNNAQRAVAMRGTAEQMAMAEWLFNQMDKPANEPVQHSASREYVIQDPRDEGVTRVFFVANAATVQDFQEVATLMRTIAEIRRVFTYNGPRAIAVRGTAEQMAMVEWLFNELDKPSALTATQAGQAEYRVSGSRDDLVRVLYLPNTRTKEDFQKAAVQIRAATSIPKVFTYNTPRALALRGTVNQIRSAERMAKDLDKP